MRAARISASASAESLLGLLCGRLESSWRLERVPSNLPTHFRTVFGVVPGALAPDFGPTPSVGPKALAAGLTPSFFANRTILSLSFSDILLSLTRSPDTPGRSG